MNIPKESLTLPPDVRLWLAEGFRTSFSENSENFLQRCKNVNRDKFEGWGKEDWNMGFRNLNLKTMTKFELSSRLMHTLQFVEPALLGE
jgi:hypothetical protein